MRTYLVQKFYIDQELAPVDYWNVSLSYFPGSRVYVTIGGKDILYYGAYPYPFFDLYTQYKVGDRVFYNGRSWQALKASIIPRVDPQYGRYENIPYPNIFPSDNAPTYWQDLGTTVIPPGTSLADITKWTQGDTRNQQLKNYMVDICLYHLHARLSPMNIPQLRIMRYMGMDGERSSRGGYITYPSYCALGWLQGVSNGDLTADLPRIQPTVIGSRIRYGGIIGTTNTY